ncbi:MAG: hypothetical protein ACREL4_09195 [Gemmatimonadales bacterium]
MNDDAPPAPPGTQLARGGRCCFLAGALLALAAAGVVAQARPVVFFEFLGFRPGMPRAAIDTAAHAAGADSLHCVVSAADRHIGECRASLSNADADRTVDLWLSTVDDTASILTLSASLTTPRLDRWRDFLVARYGAATPIVHGPITMLQWISDDRMLRLAWRAKGRGFDTSVSMVDGRVLDGWGNRRVDSTRRGAGAFP